ncbi:MAG TPA: MBG domain-containing protein, partial [Sunxiuqinia sp.]|nr:MBG domain-containing protein [Sunxiuqinia sp.]
TYDGSMTAPADTGTYAVVATITDPNYQGSASGSYVISAPANPTAVNNMAFKEQVKVYPTITHDVVHVELDNSKFDVAVYNISGQKLKLVKGANDNLVLNMSNYHPGMYILKIKVGDQAVSKRVIRQ